MSKRKRRNRPTKHSKNTAKGYKRTQRRRWTKLEERTEPFNMLCHDGTVSESSEKLRMYHNSRYVVLRTETDDVVNGENEIELAIEARDGSARIDWRDLQQIKNELLGEEAEAVQVFPAESRLVDTCNTFHLWTTKSYKCPFGFRDRHVSEDDLRQRRFDPHVRPSDLKPSFVKAVEDGSANREDADRVRRKGRRRSSRTRRPTSPSVGRPS